MPRILVVDDEPAVRNTVSLVLSGAEFEVDTAVDGETALQQASRDNYDLYILDLRLPGVSGVQVCRELRHMTLVPILILTGLNEELDKVLGLEAGADDYLTKPFGAMELLARVRALLRRAKIGGGTGSPTDGGKAPGGLVATTRLRVGELEIDLIARTVVRAGRPVRLSHREFDLLSYLARHPGQAFSAVDLIKEVWGYQDANDTRTVLVHVRWLRQKLERYPSNPELIETVKGEGYRLRA
jgi:DNA-binding response OmpR family regulator